MLSNKSTILLLLGLAIFTVLLFDCSAQEEFKPYDLIKYNIIPDVIKKEPPSSLQVSYSGVKVQGGNELRPSQVQDQPTVKWPAEEGYYYLLAMVDPDAPSRSKPIFRAWKHWLVGNIPGNNVDQGVTLAEYIGSAPPERTGLHRYVFLVYEQPRNMTFREKKLTNKSNKGRTRFRIQKFAKKYKLKGPIAGNLFQAQWESKNTTKQQ